MALLAGIPVAFSGAFELYPIVHGTRWGLMDRHGKVVVDFSYRSVRVDEAASVIVVSVAHDDGEPESFGLLDGETGEVLHPSDLRYIGDFIDGLAPIMETVEDQGQQREVWGVIDRKGRQIIAPRYRSVEIAGPVVFVQNRDGCWAITTRDGKTHDENCYDRPIMLGRAGNFIRVQSAGRTGLLDSKGRTLLPVRYDDIGFVTDRLAPASVDGKWGMIDLSGRWVVRPKYDKLWLFSEGLARFMSGDREGFLDGAGKEVISPSFEAAGCFLGGVASAQKEGKWGLIDHQGRFIAPPRYDSPLMYFDGERGLVAIGEKCGIVTRRGELVGGRTFDSVVYFRPCGIALVRQERGKGWMVMAEEGRLIEDLVFEELLVGDVGYPGGIVIDLPPEAMLPVKRDGLWGFLNLKSLTLIPCKFTYAGFFQEGLAEVVVTGKGSGFIDNRGKPVIPPRFKRVIGAFHGGLAWVEDQDGLRCYVATSGDVVWKEERTTDGGE